MRRGRPPVEAITAITGYSDPATTSFGYNNLSPLQTLKPPSLGEESLTYLGTGESNLTTLGSGAVETSELGTTKQVNESGTSYYARTPFGLLIDERLPGGASYNPVEDAQGDLVGLLNSSGELVQTVRYGPYGENPSSGGQLAYNATNDPFLFQGGYHMSGGNAGEGNVGTGLYHFGERYYDPTTGRWTQPDPAGGAGEYGFGFANDNPVNEGDENGLCAVGFVATRAKTREGRFAEAECDKKRERESPRRRSEIGDFTGTVKRERGIQGEWSWELLYRPSAPIFLVSSGPFSQGMWCHIVVSLRDGEFVAEHGPHFRPFSTGLSA